MIEIVSAQSPEQIEQVLTLAQAYVTWMMSELRTHYPAYDLASFASEHTYNDLRQKFPGEHVPPAGNIFLGLNDGRASGCIALGPLSKSICEMRTLFVDPSVRGLGLGKKLAVASILEARQLGYATMRLDTLEFMTSALQLYGSLGFKHIEPYRIIVGPLQPHIRFLELTL